MSAAEHDAAPLPPTVRAARRDGVVAITLGVLVAALFPIAAKAGTETVPQRAATAAALALAGILLRFGARRSAAVVAAFAVLAVAAFVVPAAWLLGVAGLFLLDLAVAAARRRLFGGRFARSHGAEHPEGAGTAEILESIATAFVYALVVREFAFEAFQIPTGSMEPTIRGARSGTGDHLLAAKVPLLFGEPQRWSIVVFKYPLYRPTNYIKRLVGLPGEHLEIRKGDIYVDGKIVSKPDEVQESLWRPLLPDEHGVRPLGGFGASFRPDGAGDWTFEEGVAIGASRGAEPTLAELDPAMRYDDLRLSFDADASKLSPDGAVLLRIVGAGRRVDLEASREGLFVTAPGVARTRLAAEGLGSGTTRLSLSVADRVVRVARDGRTVARLESADEPNAAGERAAASLGVRGGTVRFSDIRLDRDVRYQESGASAWDIPEGHYFMLGDNTDSSRDSRAWAARVFRVRTDRGEVEYFADRERVRVDDKTEEPSYRVTDYGWEIHDSFGVRRRIRREDLVSGGPDTSVPMPFVRREDLIGRAFFIFAPVPPWGEWRPRILP